MGGWLVDGDVYGRGRGDRAGGCCDCDRVVAEGGAAGEGRVVAACGGIVLAAADGIAEEQSAEEDECQRGNATTAAEGGEQEQREQESAGEPRGGLDRQRLMVKCALRLRGGVDGESAGGSYAGR